MQTKALLNTLKKQLKKQHITYAQVATHLSLSESSVKRLFNQSDISMNKVEQICAMIDITLLELCEMVEKQRELTSTLSHEQEQIIVDNEKLLLMTLLLLNNWQFEEIQEVYQFDEITLLRLTAELDRLGIVELLPGNKVRSKISNHFKWQQNGPLAKYFYKKIQSEYFASPFTEDNEVLHFSAGMLSSESIDKIHLLFNDVLKKIALLLEEDKKLPIAERTGIAIALTLRDWEYSGFAALRNIQQ